MTEKELIAFLEGTGPVTGAELIEGTGLEAFPLWKICRNSPKIHFNVIGKRFLRLDRLVDGYARLSPSIRREFQTYTLLCLEGQLEEMADRAALLKKKIKQISLDKFNLARESILSAISTIKDQPFIQDKACFIIAGDITYEMAHAVPRPEISTGEMVMGSDLDIIVIVDDDLSEGSVKALDTAIFKKKHFLLVHPSYREEIDYLIKRVARFREQLNFDTFESMVACKILWEGKLLLGSLPLFEIVKELLEKEGIPLKLEKMEKSAIDNRRHTEASLLKLRTAADDNEFYKFFYTLEESEEIY